MIIISTAWYARQKKCILSAPLDTRTLLTLFYETLIESSLCLSVISILNYSPRDEVNSHGGLEMPLFLIGQGESFTSSIIHFSSAYLEPRPIATSAYPGHTIEVSIPDLSLQSPPDIQHRVVSIINCIAHCKSFALAEVSPFNIDATFEKRRLGIFFGQSFNM